jgi:hypothetical protein
MAVAAKCISNPIRPATSFDGVASDVKRTLYPAV